MTCKRRHGTGVAVALAVSLSPVARAACGLPDRFRRGGTAPPARLQQYYRAVKGEQHAAGVQRGVETAHTNEGRSATRLHRCVHNKCVYAREGNGSGLLPSVCRTAILFADSPYSFRCRKLEFTDINYLPDCFQP